MRKANLNDAIKVKLNYRGMDIYRYRFDELPDVDEHGFSKFIFWEFMWLYGEHLSLGYTSVLQDGCIYFEED